MALHGNLQVNGVTIALYSIRRTDKPHAYDGWFVYDWEYVRTVDLTKKYTGSVTHLYANGAESLLEKVMSAAKKAIKQEA